jgi:serine/threonine protein kinase/formylglycine-generating enzyme required for sulfatase activity
MTRITPNLDPPDPGRGDVRRRIEAACDTFEASWQAGQPLSIDALIDSINARHRAELFRELLRIELEYRRDRGDILRAADYEARHPAWTCEVAEVFAAPIHDTGSLRSADDIRPQESSALELVSEQTTVNCYQVKRVLAEGGLGRILVAVDAALQRNVAIKQLKDQYQDDSVATQRFLREAQVTARLDHPGVVPIHGLGTDSSGHPFYAMRLVQGTSLRDRIRQLHGRNDAWSDGSWNLELRRLMTHFVTACRTVNYAHSRECVHRDLKPANILIGEFGETVVVDWGLAAMMGEQAREETTIHDQLAQATPADLTGTGVVLGTPAYMSPEQALGVNTTRTPATDVYSLGATLATLLTGLPPVAGDISVDVIQRTQRGELRYPREITAHVPLALDAICRRAMQFDPTRRYQSAGALADDLERWLAGEPVSVLPESYWTRLRRWYKRHRTVSVSALVSLITMIVLGLVGLWRFDSMARQQRAEALVETLANSELVVVKSVLRQIDQSRLPIQPLLLIRYEHALDAENAVARRNLRFALIEDNRSLLPAAVDDLVRSSPEEFVIQSRLLQPHADEIVEWVLDGQAGGATPEPLSVPLAAILALYVPRHQDWPEWAERVVQCLCDEPVVSYSAWSSAFRPVAKHLQAPLIARFMARDRHPQSSPAAELIALLYSDETVLLVDLLQHADERQLHALARTLQSQAGRAVPLLQAALRDRAPAAIPVGELDPAREPWIERDRRRARSAAALLALNRPDLVLPDVEPQANPTLTTTLIQIAPHVGVSPDMVARWWTEETIVSRRRFLTLLLGRFTLEQLAPETQTSFTEQLRVAEAAESDPGSHSAYDWLLRHWNVSRAGTSPRPYSPGRRWYETKKAEKFVIVQGPVEFLMGSPRDEYFMNPSSELHLRRIPHSFAVAAHEATQELVRQRLSDYPREGRPVFDQPNSPAACLTIYDCAKYCRRLSEEEGIPEEQMCFPPVDQIGPEMKLPNDYLTRTGYRLPTEAEWEYCAKAGTISATSYGDDNRNSFGYAWSVLNSEGVPQPVGSLMPNPLGLFDIHGNVAEWCASNPTPKHYRELPEWGRIVIEPASPARFAPRRTYVVRGGQCDYLPTGLHAAMRREMLATGDLHLIGLRPVRTLPSDLVPFDAVRLLDTPPHETRYRITGDGVPFRVEVLSEGIEVSVTEGIAPAELTLTSRHQDSRRYLVRITDTQTGVRREVSGTLIEVTWNGHVELYPHQSESIASSVSAQRWRAYRNGEKQPRELAETYTQRGVLDLNRGHGRLDALPGTDDRGYLYQATAITLLPPDEYFLQWFVNDFGMLRVDDSLTFELHPDNWYRAPGPPYQQILRTDRFTAWRPEHRWHADSIENDGMGHFWINLRPVPGLN